MFEKVSLHKWSFWNSFAKINQIHTYVNLVFRKKKMRFNKVYMAGSCDCIFSNEKNTRKVFLKLSIFTKGNTWKIMRRVYWCIFGLLFKIFQQCHYFCVNKKLGSSLTLQFPKYYKTARIGLFIHYPYHLSNKPTSPWTFFNTMNISSQKNKSIELY